VVGFEWFTWYGGLDGDGLVVLRGGVRQRVPWDFFMIGKLKQKEIVFKNTIF
jgi:hypothetical protein